MMTDTKDDLTMYIRVSASSPPGLASEYPPAPWKAAMGVRSAAISGFRACPPVMAAAGGSGQAAGHRVGGHRVGGDRLKPGMYQGLCRPLRV